MQSFEIQPHAQLRPSLWAGRLVLGRFVLALSVSRETGPEEASGKITNRLAALRLSELFHLPVEAIFSSPTAEYLA